MTTPTSISDSDRNVLRAYIDRYGLSAILLVLASICTAKAELLAQTWENTSAARDWRSDGGQLARLAIRLRH